MAASGERSIQQLYDREGRNTSSTDPKMMNSRVFIGNLPAEKVSRQDVEKLFRPYGKILGVSLHKSYGFVQFSDEDCANEAVKSVNGRVLHGLRLDVNIATERRKDSPLTPPPSRGKRPPRSPSPPPPRFRNRFEFERFRQWERFGRRSPPPPHFRDPFRGEPLDPYRYPPPPRDSYARPRDDYDRHPRDRYPPPRDYPPYPPPPRDYPRDPYDRYPPGYPPLRDREREMYDRRLPVERKDGEKLVDMEIVVVNRQQKDYAEMVCRRIENMGLVVETVHLSPTVSLADALDDAAQRGLLYAMIITSQHEMHHSLTLTILHGRNPQEHKNMPMDDALGLVDRDFERYCQNAKEGRLPPRRSAPSKDEVPNLLSKAAAGEQLDQGQLQAVINVLQRQQQAIPSHASEPMTNQPPSATDNIQRQQADLQAKILSLLGSNAVVPSSSQSSGYDGDGNSRGVTYPHGGGSSGYSSGGYDGYGYGVYR